MSWVSGAIGAVLSSGLLLVLAAKWKLPWRRSLGAIIALAVAMALLFLWLDLPAPTAWRAALVLVAQVALTCLLALGLALLLFWRDPERKLPAGEGLILSPADGKVLYVSPAPGRSTPLVTKGSRSFLLAELTGTEVPDEGAHVVGIEMNLLDVHVNRCPIGGEVQLCQRTAGQFISLRRAEAPFINERVTTVIAGHDLTVVVVQVASRLVRRIESYLEAGQQVSRGQRLGCIRFGSLVAVVVPARPDVAIAVKPGDLVTAGVSVVAHYTPVGEESNS